MTTTLFNRIEYTLASLIDAIANGQLGLPDIQRPFVWKNVNARGLFDSMYRGYPTCYLRRARGQANRDEREGACPESSDCRPPAEADIALCGD